MEQLFKEIAVGLGLPTALLFLMLKYVVIPVSKKYVEYVDKSILTLDQILINQSRIVVNQEKCSEIQAQVLMELRRIKGT